MMIDGVMGMFNVLQGVSPCVCLMAPSFCARPSPPRIDRLPSACPLHRKRGELGPIGEARADLPGPIQARQSILKTVPVSYK